MGFFNKITSLNEIPQFKVEKVGLVDTNNRAVPDTYSLQRVDNHTHLGVVKEKYVPIQLDEMINIIDTASSRIGDISHVGYAESRGGKRIVIQSELNSQIDVEGDKITPLFYTVVDNTGLGANKTIPSTIRISCDNAFHLIKQNENTDSRAFHNSLFAAKVDVMTDNIIGSINAAQNFTKIVEQLKGVKFSREEMIKFTQKLLPVKENESSKRMYKREKLVSLYESGRGNVGETKWDALNAVTEYETHTGKQTPEKLIRSLTMPILSKSAMSLLTEAA